MKKYFQSFYGKLSVVFLLLLLILGSTQIYLTMNSASHYINEVDQRLNFNLAQDMAREIKPLLKGELDFQKIGERIHYMMVMNPKVEIYLLDDSGKILAFFTEPGKKVLADRVDIAPITDFLSGVRHLPVLGNDPRNPERKKPFSAANLTLGNGDTGYLYIIIGGEQYESAAALLRESYLLKTIVKGLLFSVSGAAFVGLLLFALLTRRIHSMSEVIEEFKQGNYRQRIAVQSRDEVGKLGLAFNQLADTIVAKTEALKRKDDLRRELIANVSHDLRTPLASIQGYLETILIKEKEERLTPEERLRYLEIMLKNTEIVNKMVSELFELSRLEAQQVKPKPERFSMAELAQDVVMKFRDRAEKTQVHLKTHLQPDLPLVEADIAMIERALSNLIENAVNYTPARGSVSVEVTGKNDMIRTVVSDSGQGISARDLPYIFDRFYRGRTKNAGNKSSTGLGLTIASKIIEAHGSTIEVSSRVNEGTTFYFHLPAYRIKQ